MKAEELLCEIFECELGELQLNITLNPDKNIFIGAMKQYAKQKCEEQIKMCLGNIDSIINRRVVDDILNVPEPIFD